MAAAKMLDAIARLPGCSGEDSDAIGAYTQVPLSDIPNTTETWISIPKSQWPDEWHNLPYNDPVVLLQRNLYGHPLAGLYGSNIAPNAFLDADLRG